MFQFQVLCQVHRGHTATAQLVGESVGVGKGSSEACEGVPQQLHVSTDSHGGDGDREQRSDGAERDARPALQLLDISS